VSNDFESDSRDSFAKARFAAKGGASDSSPDPAKTKRFSDIARNYHKIAIS